MNTERGKRCWPGFLILGLLGLNSGLTAENDRAFVVGACTHFSQGKGDLQANLRAITAARIVSIRDEVGWSSVEREAGVLRMPQRFDDYVRAARATGLEPLLILDYANPHYDDGDRPRSDAAVEGFCRYAEFVVRHFGRDVRSYEIWNEWDIGIGLPERHRKGGSAEDYVRLLKAVYPRIKAVDPGITVMAGACTSGGVKKGWLEEIVQQGALDFSDAISIHSYNYSAGFPERSPEACAAWMQEVEAMLRGYHQDRAVPFYVTEMGWPTHIGKRGTEPALAGSYLARLFLLARTSPSFQGLWWYDFQDDGWDAQDNEDNFGLVRSDLTPKPAFGVLAGLADLVTEGVFMGRLESPDDQLWILRFRLHDRQVWAVWCGDDRERQVVFGKEEGEGEVMLRQLGYPDQTRKWGQRLWAENRGDRGGTPLISLVVGARPTVMSGDLDRVAVVQVIPRFREMETTSED